MSNAVRYDMVADRNSYFEDYVARVGVNWSAATFKMQVRTVADTSGPAILDLTLGAGLALAYAGTDTVANHIASHNMPIDIYGHTNPATGAMYAPSDSVAFSRLAIIVNATGMNWPLYSAERGDDFVAVYDIFLDPDGGSALNYEKQFYGTFTLRSSVTL